MTRRRRSTALHYFTLVELLVVIAIFAILAALLLPALRRAIREAHEVVCMNNIRQLCVAAINYKDDYYGYYPPPVSWRQLNGPGYQLHPHDLKASDIGHIAPYIGIDPSQLDLKDGTEITEKQWPAVMRCPFSGKFVSGQVPFYNNYYNEQPPGGVWYYPMGYAYFGSLTGPFPTDNPPIMYGVAPGFERKFASRNCDPDAALWGDSVSYNSYNGNNRVMFTHAKSGGFGQLRRKWCQLRQFRPPEPGPRGRLGEDKVVV